MNLLRFWVATPGAQALGWTLVHSLWEGALVALVLGATLSVMRSARARYAAACAAMLVLVAAFALTFVREMPEAPVHSAMQASHAASLAARPLPLSAQSPDAAEPNRLAFLPWLTPLWLAGVLAFQLRGLAAWKGARRMRGTGVCAAPAFWRARLDALAQRARVSRPVALLESCLAEVPVVIGYVRPAILLPVGLLAGLPAAQVEAILLHELVHIRRHDYLVNLLQLFVEGLLFHHPAAWWISAVIRAERENCCDDMVVATQGDAYGYASALAALEERRATGDAVLASTGGSLVKRIQRLLAPPEGPRAGLTPVFSAVILTVTLMGGVALWQTRPAIAATEQSAPVATPAQAVEVPPVRRPVTQQVAQAQRSAARFEQAQAMADPALPALYRKWLNEDVAYIISAEERARFRGLQTDNDRESFIEQFWLVRDPTPGTPENEMKEEHYRRIAYANEHFAPVSGLPGWKTDRGRIYITFGPPDEIDSHANGGTFQRPASEGGGSTVTFPFEQWRYKFIEGVGTNVNIEFVDPTFTGEYRLTMDPTDKDALRYVLPPANNAFAHNLSQVSAGATIQIVGNNGVQLSIPLSRYDDHKVNIYVRIVDAESRNTKASPFEQTVQGQMTFSRFLALTPGTYRLDVIVKDLDNGTTSRDLIPFEVK